MLTQSPDKPATADHPTPAATPNPGLDYYHALWGRLNGLGGGDQPPRTLGVTSCAAAAGVTTVVENLAAAAAESLAGQQVLVVDANHRAPALHARLGTPITPGLTDVLSGRVEWRAAVQSTRLPDVSLLPAGDKSIRVTSAADLARCAELLSEWQGRFDIIVMDLPPAAEAGLTLPLSGMLDGVLLVIEAERVSGEAARRVKDMLMQSHARLLGAVLNQRRRGASHWAR
jgi:Mrp family chromosome partitioning ATPase